MIEIRNDVIRTEAEQTRWADRLAHILGSDADSARPGFSMERSQPTERRGEHG
jgi:predicted N-formylglutamate amidohydrolase